MFFCETLSLWYSNFSGEWLVGQWLKEGTKTEPFRGKRKGVRKINTVKTAVAAYNH